MNIFLDTSSLFKLYHKEQGTDIIDSVFINNTVSSIFISEITKIEFASAAWKKARNQEITEQQASNKIKMLYEDLEKYTVVEIDTALITSAGQLIEMYGRQGLRTLDSIQLSSAVLIKDKCDVFITTDKLLNSLFEQEGLSTKIPGGSK